MRMSDWATIYVTEEDETRMRQNHSSTFSVVKDMIATILANQIQAMTGTVGVWFASGCRPFLSGFVGHEGTPLMTWLEHSGRRRPRDSSTRKWFGVSHETVGGSTTAKGVFGHEGRIGGTGHSYGTPVTRHFAHPEILDSTSAVFSPVCG